MEWKGKVAIVTGASSGIGRATAIALARRGVLVVIAARRADRLDTLCAEIEAGKGTAFPVITDVAEESSVDRLFESTMQKCERLDWLINNAGSGLFATIEETTPDQFERIWRTNFMGTFYCIRKAIPIMKNQGSGHILTVSSMAGVRGTPMKGAYCATKSAQIALMDSLRRELEGMIHCTTVLPGATESEFIDSMENPENRKIDYSGPVRPPSAVAEAILHAIEHPCARVITMQFGRTLSVLNAVSPDMTDWLVGKMKK